MPTRKTLKSVAHNIGYSIMSLMNHDGSMYFCERIFEMVKETGITKIEFDFINKIISPKEFDVPMVRLRSHFDWIPYSAEAENSSKEFIKSIKMTLEYDLSKTRRSDHNWDFYLESYVCTVIIIDDKGKEHKAIVPEWWYSKDRGKTPVKKLTWWEKVWKRNKFN